MAFLAAVTLLKCCASIASTALGRGAGGSSWGYMTVAITFMVEIVSERLYKQVSDQVDDNMSNWKSVGIGKQRKERTKHQGNKQMGMEHHVGLTGCSAAAVGQNPMYTWWPSLIWLPGGGASCLSSVRTAFSLSWADGISFGKVPPRSYRPDRAADVGNVDAALHYT